ncbi:MAG: stage II sporulation protein M [Pirellulales bacterium]
MTVHAENIAKRRADWERLETLLGNIATGARNLRGPAVMELSDLYRRACADLALAEQYHLSPSMVDYLHTLVGRMQAALHKSPRARIADWWDVVFRDAPRQIFRDPCVQVASVLFFGLFALSALLAYNEEMFPKYAERMISAEQIVGLENMYDEPLGRNTEESIIMVGFYINHNTGIGLECFGTGLLIVPGLIATAFNASFLGACFGYMSRLGVEGGDHFLEFVDAHGALELSAIALSAGGGLRIGLGWLFTNGLTRLASLQAAGRRALPIMSASGVLFCMAAFTEGIISPLPIPYAFKVLWLLASTCGLMFYFVVLGYPEDDDAA